MKYFNKDQLLTISFDDLVTNPSETCNKVLTYLGVDSTIGWKPKGKVKNKRSYEYALEDTDLKFLENFYAEPNRKLTELMDGKRFW